VKKFIIVDLMVDCENIVVVDNDGIAVVWVFYVLYSTVPTVVVLWLKYHTKQWTDFMYWESGRGLDVLSWISFGTNKTAKN
jgi:hypothetical protein